MTHEQTLWQQEEAKLEAIEAISQELEILRSDEGDQYLAMMGKSLDKDAVIERAMQAIACHGGVYGH